VLLAADSALQKNCHHADNNPVRAIKHLPYLSAAHLQA